MDDAIEKAETLSYLMNRWGPLLRDDEVRQALAYPSMGALRRAIDREATPVAVFHLPKRKGLYARASDIADWLVRCRPRDSSFLDSPACTTDEDPKAFATKPSPKHDKRRIKQKEGGDHP